MRFIKYLKRKSSSKNIILGIFFIFFVNLVLFPYFSTKTTNFETILDVHFGFSLDVVLRNLSVMKEEGRKHYLYSTLFIDTPYALIYGFIYAFIIAALQTNKQNTHKLNYVILIPFIISFFDLFENIGIVYFVTKYPNINSKLVTIISISNQLKWVFALLTFILIVYLLLRWVIAKSGSNKSDT